MSTRVGTLDDEQADAPERKGTLPLERRRHERLSVYLRVRWEGLMGAYEGMLSDISAGGCFILSDERVALRELLRLEIQLHTGEWMKVWGVVTNCFAPVGFGVMYTEVDDDGDGDKISMTFGQTKLIHSAVAALKRLHEVVFKKQAGADGRILISLREYKSKLLLALPHVSRAVNVLPDCQKKTALKLAVQAYADAGKIWAVMTEEKSADNEVIIGVYKRLKETYEAPMDILEALLENDFNHVLQFLWQKGYICLTFAS
jgi:PilZ domain